VYTDPAEEDGAALYPFGSSPSPLEGRRKSEGGKAGEWPAVAEGEETKSEEGSERPLSFLEFGRASRDLRED